MCKRVLVCGGNGAGKSTLGRALAKKLGWPFFDIEDYYFPHRRQGEPYRSPKSQEEVSRRLLDDLQRQESCVLAAVKADFGKEVQALLTLAVLLEVPKELRMERIRERSRQKFGDRILPGGELYESEQAFFTMAERRPENQVEDWLSTTGLPVLRLDGTKPIEENVRRVFATLE